MCIHLSNDGVCTHLSNDGVCIHLVNDGVCIHLSNDGVCMHLSNDDDDCWIISVLHLFTSERQRAKPVQRDAAKPCLL